MWRVGVGGYISSEREHEYINDVLNSGRLTYGSYSKKFEESFAKIHDCQFGVLSNSGTSSLEVALATLKEYHHWSDGDEVIVPATTFVASVNVILMNKLTPILVDIDPLYYEIDPELIESKITPKTRCIMVVHLFGQPCDMSSIWLIAQTHRLKIIEDSCETMFARYLNRSVGSLGDISCFSMYSAHIMCTGVGGIATTNHKDYAIIMRSLVNHGRDNIYISIDDGHPDDSEYHKEVISRRFRFVRLGYSYRITELEACLGLAQLERWTDLISRRQYIAQKYINGLQKYQSMHLLQLPHTRPTNNHVFMMFPIVITTNRFNKTMLTYYLEEQGIETRDMLPLINQPCYANIIDIKYSEYPQSHLLIDNGFYIGSHPYISDESIDYVLKCFTTFLDPYVPVCPE